MKCTLFLTLALTAAAQAYQPDHFPEPPATALDAPTTVPFTMDFDIPVIELMINGTGPYPFILDTGCSPLLIINDDLVKQLGIIATGKQNVGDPSDPQAIETDTIVVDSVRAGGAEFTNVNALSWQRPGFFTGNGAPRGVVGLPIFGDLLTTFDFPAQTVTLRNGSLPKTESTIPFNQSGGVPEIALTINGKTSHAHLDTGSAGGFSFPIAAADNLKLNSKPEVVGAARTVNSEFNIYAATLDGELSIGPITLVNPQIGFQDGFNPTNIGCGVFANLKLTFDQRQNLLLIESDQPRVVQPKQRKRYGIMPAQNSLTGDLTVGRCVEGSPADRAGVREGDQITAINGTPIADLSGADRMKAFKASPIILTLLRDGQELEIEVSLDDE